MTVLAEALKRVISSSRLRVKMWLELLWERSSYS